MGFISSCDGDLRYQPVVASEKSGLFSSCKGLVGIPLESLPVNRAVSRVQSGNSVFLSAATGISGFLSRFNKGIRPRLVLRHGTLHFSRVVKGVSGLRSSSGGDLGIFQEDRQGRQASHPVVRGYSVHWIHWSRCTGAGESGLIWSGGGTRRPFSLQQDPWGSTRDSSGDTGLLLWCEGNLGFLLS